MSAGGEYETGALLDLDPSEFVAGAEEAADASGIVADSSENMSDSLWDVEPAGVAAGGALAGIGTAAQNVLDETQETRESLGRTAQTMGITTDQAEDLATSMSNATFPLEDVEGTMATLAEQGIGSKDQMQEVAEAADMVADATGTTAESVAENAGPALEAMGEDAADLEEHMDSFTYVARNTTMDVEDFSRMVRKTGPELRDLEMGVDDTAAVMSALEDRGLDSRTAMREFRQAARDADGDQEELMDTLDLTNDELEDHQDELADAEGTTQDHAEAANESLSTMDSVRARFEDATLAASSYLEPLSGLAPVAQTAGVGLMTLSTINVSAVAPSFAAVSAAAAPITAVVLGVAAAAAALYKAWDTNFLGIQQRTETSLDALGAGFDWITDKISDSVDWVVDKVVAIPDVVGDVVDAIPGIDSEDVLGDVDVDEITDNMFPPKPDEEGEDVGEEMGTATAESSQEAVEDAGGLVPEPDEVAASGSSPSSSGSSSSQPAPPDGTMQADRSGGGSLSASAIRDALEGMVLEVSGPLDVTGDVATLDDLNARFRRDARRNRGSRS